MIAAPRLCPIVLSLALLCLPVVPGCYKRDPGYWFEDIGSGLVLTDGEIHSLLLLGRQALETGRIDGEELSTLLATDRKPRLAFLSLSDTRSRARVALGSGRGIVAAVSSAARKLRNQTPWTAAGDNNGSGTEKRKMWLKLDIPQAVMKKIAIDTSQGLKLDRSLFGLAFSKRSGMAFLPEELIAGNLIDKNGILSPQAVVTHVESSGGRVSDYWSLRESPITNLYRFSCSSAVLAGDSFELLRRGHRIVSSVSASEALDAARTAAQYLNKALRGDGSFVYSYRPGPDKAGDDYNILRHAGTSFALLELYRCRGGREIFETAEKSIEFLLKSVENCGDSAGELRCVVEDGYAKLGGSALAVVAISEYRAASGNKRFDGVAQGLASWILSLQRDDGSFYPHKQSHPEGRAEDFVSAYYPGEALLALVRMYGIDGNTRWLDKAELGARYLIETRDAGLGSAALPHDHWLLRALSELQRERPQESYRAYAAAVTQSIIGAQQLQPPYQDWRGGFYSPPRNTSTATRGEALCAARSLLPSDATDKLDTSLRTALELGAAFQLRNQTGPAIAMYWDHPQRVLGGFHRELSDWEMRIDYQQHNISSLLCYATAISPGICPRL